jgi:hypothetical protein
LGRFGPKDAAALLRGEAGTTVTTHASGNGQ